MSKLDELAQSLLDAAYEYWKEYHKTSFGNAAVVWIENHSNGHFVCFTRGEYRQDIKDVINELGSMFSYGVLEATK